MQKKKLLNILRYLIFLLLTVALMYFAFRNIEPQALWAGLKETNFLWVLMSVLVGIISYIIRAVRWRLLIEPLGHKPSFTNTYHAVMIGYLANLAVPRIGEVSRCGILNKTEKIPFDRLVGTVVLERVFDLLFLLFAILITVLIRIDVFGAFLSEKVWQPISKSVVAMCAHPAFLYVALLVIAAVVALLYFFRDSMRSLGAVRKVKSLLEGFWKGIKGGLKMKQRGAFLLYSLLIIVCYWMMSYTMMLAIPETARLTIIDALFLFILGGLGWVVPAQGGFGSYHLMVASGLGIYGITFEKGIIFATISHESQVLFMLILGLTSLACVFHKLKKNPHIIT